MVEPQNLILDTHEKRKSNETAHLDTGSVLHYLKQKRGGGFHRNLSFLLIPPLYSWIIFVRELVRFFLFLFFFQKA